MTDEIYLLPMLEGALTIIYYSAWLKIPKQKFYYKFKVKKTKYICSKFIYKYSHLMVQALKALKQFVSAIMLLKSRL